MFGAKQSTIGLASKAFPLGWIFHHATLCTGHSRCPKVERCNECSRTFDSSCRIKSLKITQCSRQSVSTEGRPFTRSLSDLSDSWAGKNNQIKRACFSIEDSILGVDYSG